MRRTALLTSSAMYMARILVIMWMLSICWPGQSLEMMISLGGQRQVLDILVTPNDSTCCAVCWRAS